MGLDQWLIKKIYVGGRSARNKEDYLVVERGGEVGEVVGDIRIQIKNIEDIETRVIYWRKNYAINDWFLDKVGAGDEDNCVYFYVNKDDLKELRDILKEIVEAKTKKEKIKIVEEKLDTGDFDEYTDSYLEDFERTYKELDEVIKAKDFDVSDYYYYIWY